MLRTIFTGLIRPTGVLLRGVPKIINQPKNYHILANVSQFGYNGAKSPKRSILASKNESLLQNEEIQKISLNISRSVTKFSLRKGKRKTVKAVIKRFYRLGWGGWIRTMSGRHKKIWKKSMRRRNKLKQHVLVNAQQSTLLDNMVTKFWTRRKYYPEDPYEPYHQREEFYRTRQKPV